MTRVLVTGATGFVGDPTVAALRARGIDVVVHGIEDGDLLVPGGAASACAKASASHLVHLAWCATGDYLTTPANIEWMEASLALLRAFAANGGRRVVLAGSVAEYAPDSGWCDEATSATRPSTLYGAAKLATASAAMAAATSLGIEVVEGRLFQLYGPREHRDRFVPMVIRALLRGAPAKCSEGVHQRDFVHVEDAGDALAALVGSSAIGVVNIGTGVATPVRDVAMTIGELVGRPELIQLGAAPTRAGEAPLLAAKVDRLRDEIGWTPRHTVRSGLADTVAWWTRSHAT